MKKKFYYIIFLMAILFSNNLFAETLIQNSDIVWKNITSGIKKANLKIVVTDPNNIDIAYAASAKTLYKTNNGGKIWRPVFDTRSKGKDINFVSINPNNSDILYVACESGLYKSSDRGVRWMRIFKGIGEEQSNINNIAISPEGTIYTATQSGLFIYNNKHKVWNRTLGELSDAGIYYIAIDPLKSNILYAATNKGVYKSTDRGERWRRLYINRSLTINYDIEYNNEGSNEKRVNSIVVHPVNNSILYAATDGGVFMSRDSGDSWYKITGAGLGKEQVRFVTIGVVNPETLYVATSSGVFKFSNALSLTRFTEVYSGWEKLYKGIRTKDVKFIELDKNGNNIWAATNKGLFRARLYKQEFSQPLLSNASIEFNNKELRNIFSNEPTVREIQNAAIEYAEVSPEKIKQWRRAASLKALLPTLSGGVDGGRNVVSSSASTAKPRIYFEDGPDKVDWDFDLSWDLSELIWNNDQTSIDNRSKLMVQLRDDIVDEVTRLYFERKRLQIQLAQSVPEDKNELIEKQLRLEELTAYIDGLTGGYLSKRLQAASSN